MTDRKIPSLLEDSFAIVVEEARSRGVEWKIAVSPVAGDPEDVLVEVQLGRAGRAVVEGVRMSHLFRSARSTRVELALVFGRLDERLDALVRIDAAQREQEQKALRDALAAGAAEIEKLRGEAEQRGYLEAGYAAQRSLEAAKIAELEEQLAEQKRLFDSAIDRTIEQTVLGPIAEEMGMPTPKLERLVNFEPAVTDDEG